MKQREKPTFWIRIFRDQKVGNNSRQIIDIDHRFLIELYVGGVRNIFVKLPIRNRDEIERIRNINLI